MSPRSAPPLLRAGSALFLDLDGTLIEIADTPMGVVVSDALRDLLATLGERLDGALAMVSGRPIAQLDELLRPLRLSAAGQHGLEWRGPDGVVHRHPAAAPSLEMLAALQRFAVAHPGTALEHKGASVALHYRGRPACAHDAAAAVEAIVRADPGTWDVLHGKMVVEVRPAGVHKGVGIERLMAEPPFAGRTPTFVGDDWTDEDGFGVVNARGGTTVVVGRGRESRAAYALADVPAVHRWLRESVAGFPLPGDLDQNPDQK